jgi:serine/threonine protein phosphatase PrpC
MRTGHNSMNFFQRLLAREQPATEDKQLASREENYPAALNLLPPGLTVAKISDIGRVRERNEDSYLAIDMTFQSDAGLIPMGLYIVADGMGGHQKGEIASSLAAKVSAHHIMQDVFLPFLSDDEQDSSRRPINEALIQAVQAANLAVYQQAPEAGTTLTMALVFGHKAYVAHVGDSRAYVFNQATLRQITQDHSLVARLVELGQATPEEALTHTHRNVLYRAIGQAGSLEVDTYLQPFPVGSGLLLCSDGLWGLLSDDELGDILTYARTPQDAVGQMVEAANRKGGDDNITAVLVFMGES